VTDVQALRHNDNTVVVTLPFRASSARSVRARISSDLTDAGLTPAVIDDTRVVVSELVGNSIRHADPLPSGRLLVSWRVAHDAVVVSVTDGGSSSTPRVAHTGDDALGGRGMAIVETLARRWWVDQGASGTTVIAEVALR
jgi:anti-sigma regulatory factor (Ser/Thr protein kinase)